VTGDFPTTQMSTEREQLLLPLAQHPSPNLFVVARSSPGEPATKVTAALENAVRDLGPEFSRDLSYADDLRFSKIVTGAWLRQNSMRDFLVQSAVAGGTGGVILMLSALGIYGVVGLMVATRTREIAVRVALGASRRRVLRVILFDVVKLVMPGIGVGLILTVALMRLRPPALDRPLEPRSWMPLRGHSPPGGPDGRGNPTAAGRSPSPAGWGGYSAGEVAGATLRPPPVAGSASINSDGYAPSTDRARCPWSLI